MTISNVIGTLDVPSPIIRDVVAGVVSDLGLAVTPSSATLAAEETQQLTATLDGQDITTQVAWTSSDETKATVSATGLVTAVATGSATITASYGQHTSTAAITVS